MITCLVREAAHLRASRCASCIHNSASSGESTSGAPSTFPEGAATVATVAVEGSRGSSRLSWRTQRERREAAAEAEFNPEAAAARARSDKIRSDATRQALKAARAEGRKPYSRRVPGTSTTGLADSQSDECSRSGRPPARAPATRKLDWICLGCQAQNFARRAACFKCTAEVGWDPGAAAEQSTVSGWDPGPVVGREKKLRVQRGSRNQGKLWRHESVESALEVYASMKLRHLSTADQSNLPPSLNLGDYNELLNKVAPTHPDAALAILAEMGDANVRPDEASFLALIRACAGAGDDATRGPALLDEMAVQGVAPRLRSFVPLLDAAFARCHALVPTAGQPSGGLDAALGLWLRMRRAGVAPKEEHCVGLIRALLLGSCSITTRGSNAGGWAGLGEDVVDALVWRGVEDILSVDLAPHNRTVTAGTAKAIVSLLTEHAAAAHAATRAEEGREAMVAHAQTAAQRVGPWSFFFSPIDEKPPQPEPPEPPTCGRLCGTAKEVDLSPLGECPCCGGRARLLGLSKVEARRMRSNLLAIAARSDIDQNFHLQEFSEWLATRTLSKRPGASQKPFTAVVDGANVAWSRQNHLGGAFSFAQIQAVVDELTARGERPLIVLPRRYMTSSVVNQSSYNRKTKQLPVSSEDEALRKAWTEKGCVFTPRFGWADDDWYWMYATLTDDDPCFVVTNDEMRDHRLALLGPREFRRWREKHVVNFDLGGSGWASEGGKGFINRTEDKAVEPPPPPLEVTIVPTALFSREVQATPAKDDSKNDSKGDSKGRHWHLPIGEDPGQGRDAGRAWLCLTLPDTSALPDYVPGYSAARTEVSRTNASPLEPREGAANGAAGDLPGGGPLRDLLLSLTTGSAVGSAEASVVGLAWPSLTLAERARQWVRPPTEKKAKFGARLAGERGVEVPPEAMESSAAMSAFINGLADSATGPTRGLAK